MLHALNLQDQLGRRAKTGSAEEVFTATGNNT